MDWIFIGVGFLIGIYIYFNCIHGKFIINNKGSIIKVKSLDQIKREYQANYVWACETFGVNVFNKDINKPMNSDYWIWSNVSWIVESRTHVQRYYPYNLKFPKCKIGDTSCNGDSSIPSWTKDFMIEFNQICDDMKNRITPEDLALYKKYGVSYKAILKD